MISQAAAAKAKELVKVRSKILMAEQRADAGEASGEARKAKSNGTVKASVPLKKPKKSGRDRSKPPANPSPRN